MEFEWDEAKRLTNLAKHQFDFLDAPLVFDGNHVEADGRKVKDEARWLVTGITEGHFVTIVCTYRGEACRIISFRRARDGERRRYQVLHGR